MRRRLPVSPRGDSPEVKIIRLERSTKLVTLEHPDEDQEAAHNAFCRIRPPKGLTDAEIDSWAYSVRKIAKALTVLPAPRSADVPDDAQRVGEDEVVGTVREEALKLAKETGKDAVVKMTTQILDEVGI